MRCRSTVLGALALGVAGTVAASPPVNVALRTSWEKSPFLLEVLETISLHNPTTFIPLIDAVTSPSSPFSPSGPLNPNGMSDEAVHQTIMDLALRAGLVKGRAEAAEVEMELGLHAASVRIEAGWEFYESHVRAVHASTGKEGDGGCESWVEWYGESVCDVETLAKLVGIETIDPPPTTSGQTVLSESTTNNYPRPKTLPFDHIHPSPTSGTRLSRPPRTAILYAPADRITSESFRELHAYLYAQSSKSEEEQVHVEYVLRFVPPSSSTTKKKGERSYLSGYGVSLDLKKTDYLAVDDRHQNTNGNGNGERLENEESGKAEEEEDPIMKLLDTFPINETAPDASTPLTPEELESLATRATHLLSLSPSPLSALKHLSQNFPKYAAPLARRIISPPVPQALEEELHANALQAQSGVSMAWLNGAVITNSNAGPGGGEELQPMDLLRMLRRERGIVRTLVGEGLMGSAGEAVDVIAHEAISKSASQGGGGEATDGLVDASDRVEGEGEVIMWWNDLEKDKRYERWPDSLSTLLRPTYPGQLHPLRRNLYNVVLCLDLSRLGALQFVAGPVGSIVERLYPIRFGVVTVWQGEGGTGPVVPEDKMEGKMMARLFGYVWRAWGRKRTMGFLKGIVAAHTPHSPQSLDSGARVDWERVKHVYEEVVDEMAASRGEGLVEFDDVVSGAVFEGKNGDGDGGEEKGKVRGPDFGKIEEYARRVGAMLEGSSGCGFVNGRWIALDDDFLRAFQRELTVQLQYVQERLFAGAIGDETFARRGAGAGAGDPAATAKPEESGAAADDGEKDGKEGDAEKEMEEEKEEKKPKIEHYFYDLPTTSKRRSRWVHPAQSGAHALRVKSLAELGGVGSSDSGEGEGGMMDKKNFVYPEDEGEGSVEMSVWVVGDFDGLDGPGGRDMLREGLAALVGLKGHSGEGKRKFRLGFVHHSFWDTTASSESTKGKKRPRPLSWYLAQLPLHKVSPSALLKAIETDSMDEFVSVYGLSPSHSSSSQRKPEERHRNFVRQGRLVSRALGLSEGTSGVVVNGRVVGPIDVGTGFGKEDLEALVEYEWGRRVEGVVGALRDVKPSLFELDRASVAHVVAIASSLVSSIQLPDPSESGLFDSAPRPRSRPYRVLEDKYTKFEFGDNKTALYQLTVLLDPLSVKAQKWSSLLEWLASVPDIFIEVRLNPGHYTEMPLKRFYRYNISPSLAFDESGYEVPAQTTFSSLPTEPIYTLGMDVPHSWLVRPREALYDLDNIQLGQLSPEDKSVDAVFDLDFLVIEGHAREEGTISPTRGVQLELLSGEVGGVEGKKGTLVDDTLVAANLGYLQFKAKPGVFALHVKPGTRGERIYDMESVGNEGWDSPNVRSEAGSEITVASFEGVTLYPRLRRKVGMERVDVLGEEDEDEGAGGLFGEIKDTVMSFFSSSKGEKGEVASVDEQAEINIFTVASGLLYERFASIMILSVLRNTKSTVKFWFIENFLSPSFLEFIPHLASAYNFKYELVTYKWPSWLRAQTEKQRIIWAYKILFLDVLFPMDLKKVIFVDADQIVRADLKELIEVDLHGAPYGYTPMGDDNTDMEGFRFWKTGYWKDFLQGMPYHISALYVIDLVKFRQMAAGDILRTQYQQLSADPNSLANLDQDLPNNLQRQVPIFSLHEDWLWCETWCSKDRLNRAKTIDLCQNPLTKEPKLARARQIPEWEKYDAEISHFAQKLAAEGLIKSRIAAADTTVLAGSKVDEKASDSPDAAKRPTGEAPDASYPDDRPIDEL